MSANSKNFIKNYFLQKMLDTRLFFFKEAITLTDFLGELFRVKKILVILPIDRVEEVEARKFLPEIQSVFKGAKVSTLDLSSLRNYDTNWLGVPNHKYLTNIRQENFELLMDLNGHHDRICCYLGALTEAPLRIHATEGKFDKVYNLHFRGAEGASLQDRYRNMLNYMRNIRGQ
ncbi:MAG: hypothetical protein E4H13_05800 [Calditrichales bacterium]|nr:MAG: hypothetical protein E4H13_05800 [Calditrichales bacterium]